MMRESTVSSLLASSGRLRSSLHPEPVQIIRYKDRSYESASEALDAYIADFQQSLKTSEASVGHLELPKQPAKPRLHQSGHRNRDVLKESLTETELNFLKLPVGSKHRESDHLSVTTDDLLVLPSDGTLPVTRTSAFLSQSGSYPLGHSVNSASWSHARPGAAFRRSRQPSLRTSYREKASDQESRLCVDDLLMSSVRLKRGPVHPGSVLTKKTGASPHLPRWMTSHKSEMDFSGVTSIPDSSYPVWLKHCDAHTDSASGVPVGPSWIRDADEGHRVPKEPKKRDSQSQDNQNTLREMRLQFTETKNRGSISENGEPFRGDRIDSLIQRAEQVLNSPSLGLCGPAKKQQSSPGDTEELLEADRSWDNPPVTFKSPVPVSDPEEQLFTEESQRDAAEKSVGSSSGYSSRKHHGPVEALKQMLFSLQAVEQRVTQQHREVKSNPVLQAENSELKEASPSDAENYNSAPGEQSLQRALHHLGRLKSLVDEMNEKKAREVEEGKM